MDSKRTAASKKRAFRRALAIGVGLVLVGSALAQSPLPDGLPGLPPPLLPAGNAETQAKPAEHSVSGTRSSGLHSNAQQKVGIKLSSNSLEKSAADPKPTSLKMTPTESKPTQLAPPSISSAPTQKSGKVVVRVREASQLTSSPTETVQGDATWAPRGMATGLVRPAIVATELNPPPNGLQMPAKELPGQGGKGKPQVQGASETPTAGPIKMSIGDDGVVDLGVQNRPKEATVIPRAPELVKPRKYSLTQTVVMSEASDIIEDSSVGKPNSVSKPALDGATFAKLGDTDSRQVPKAMTSGTSVDSLPKPPRKDIASADAVTNTTAINTVATAVAPTLPLGPSASKSPSQAALIRAVASGTPERVYDIESLGTYSIDVPFEIAQVLTNDSEVCSVFNNGQSITIAGGKPGQTRIGIQSRDGETRVIGVNVVPSGQQFSRPKNELNQVKDLISKMFPNANIQFVPQDSGAIEVIGVTRTEEDARKVLELVRKVCLVPIIDKVRASQ